jgi:hypothetical protein
MGPVFMFCASGLIFGGNEAVGSHFHVLRARTRFWRYRGVMSRFHVLHVWNHFRPYRGCRVPLSCFVRKLVYGGTVGDGSHFDVLRSLTHFRR